MAAQAPDHSAVVIIGAGFSGICTAIDLIRRNNCDDFIIVEKSDSVGGTWYLNTYPGCACDVWSQLYSFSFEQNPNWSKFYPGQEEILEYLRKLVKKYELEKRIRFNTFVEESRWDEAEKSWKTLVRGSKEGHQELSDSYTLTSDFLVSAVGQLNRPSYPDISGIDRFKGKLMHSAEWDWSYSLAGKRVAIIGNGASAVQIVPEVAKVASQVTVHQRTPNWIVNRMDFSMPAVLKSFFRLFPPLLWRVRAMEMDLRESTYDGLIDDKSKVTQAFKGQCVDAIEKSFPNQHEMRDALTPNYLPGCKRILLSDDYYDTLALPHVKLETRPIECISETGIQLENNISTDYDLIVMATGFRTTEFLHPIKITGLNGRTLSDVWHEGPHAYLGVAVEDLPNFCMLYGPNTNLGHNSIIAMIEAQSRYINTLISAVMRARQSNLSLSVKPKLKAVYEYNERIQRKLTETSFADPACNSWYKTKDGKILNNWSGTVIEYQKLLAQVKWSDYDIEGSGLAVVRDEETYIGRVKEETTISNAALAAGVFGALAVTAGYLMRGSRKVPRVPFR